MQHTSFNQANQKVSTLFWANTGRKLHYHMEENLVRRLTFSLKEVVDIYVKFLYECVVSCFFYSLIFQVYSQIRK